MLEHNPNLKEHKILLEDCRSLLKFNDRQVKDIEKELYLFNDYIKIIFQFLKDIELFGFYFGFGLKFDLKDHYNFLSSYEIMANENNWSFIIEMEFNSIIDLNVPFDILEIDLIKKIKENHLTFKLSYFESTRSCWRRIECLHYERGNMSACFYHESTYRKSY
jgi:hypothetical protein